ncbi:MAE_28990/MAE_18760 family HEPN-like nuclease [Paraburkholderia gardini]|nr:MAE_28990/MAE_18760 family HEPN-like nuclease [Paraburkholderia gardini]
MKTVNMFLSHLKDEFVWRQMEIIDTRLDVKTIAETKTHRTRAGVILAYAHWEGFVKTSTEFLLNFISNKRLANRGLRDIFLLYSLKTHVSRLVETDKTQPALEALRFVLGELDKPCKMSYKNSVDTGSNLSSLIFDNIAKSVGIDVGPYLHLYPYIDESIVDRRNTIAHGQRLLIERDDFQAMTDRVLQLMEMYKTDLENLVVTESYRTQ